MENDSFFPHSGIGRLAGPVEEEDAIFSPFPTYSVELDKAGAWTGDFLSFFFLLPPPSLRASRFLWQLFSLATNKGKLLSPFLPFPPSFLSFSALRAHRFPDA